MTDQLDQARIVIIGGGAVGCSALYHLAKMGQTDALLIERNELTAGSTWHAAGNCPTFSTSLGMMKLQRYSMELYRDLENQTGTPFTYNVTGTIRLAHSLDRMREFEQVRAWGNKHDMPVEMMSIQDMKDQFPFMETHDLEGGYWDSHDGDADPASLTQALATGARKLGARIRRHTAVTGVRREGEEWIVETDKGEIRCEIVVNAAGYYAQRVGEWFKPYGGRTVPMVVLQHQYMLTEEIPEIVEWTKEHGRKLPMIRDPDVSYYLRQEKAGLNLGPYEKGGQGAWLNGDMPEDFSFQLYPDDLERLEHYIEDACARVPLLGQSGINKVINGPIPYAPDGLPLIGPMPGVKNAFEACVFTFGIAQAGGAGKALAEWITEGQTEWDLWCVDPRRFGKGHIPQEAVNARGIQVYRNEYAMHHPHHAWPEGRDLRLSPAHDRIKAAGGQMGPFGDWERALWYARPGDDTSEAATETWERKGPWWDAVAEECAAVRDAVGVIDICGFSRFNLSGAGAADWLAGKIAGRLPKAGRVGLAYFADDRGRCVTEMSVFRHGDDDFTLITAAAAQSHDFDWLAMDMPKGLSLTDHTDEISVLLVTGPEARSLMQKIDTQADLTKPWLTHQDAVVAGKPCRIARVSYAGELGWEIHAENAHIPDLWDAVTGAGARPFGMFALNSMRVEKCWLAWKGDISTDYTLPELGLDRFMRDPGDAPESRLVLLEHDGEIDPLYMSNISHDGKIVGEVTSACWGHRTGKALAMAMIPVSLGTANTQLSIDVFGQQVPARVLPGPVWDADFSRIRA